MIDQGLLSGLPEGVRLLSPTRRCLTRGCSDWLPGGRACCLRWPRWQTRCGCSWLPGTRSSGWRRVPRRSPQPTRGRSSSSSTCRCGRWPTWQGGGTRRRRPCSQNSAARRSRPPPPTRTPLRPAGTPNSRRTGRCPTCCLANRTRPGRGRHHGRVAGVGGHRPRRDHRFRPAGVRPRRLRPVAGRAHCKGRPPLRLPRLRGPPVRVPGRPGRVPGPDVPGPPERGGCRDQTADGAGRGQQSGRVADDGGRLGAAVSAAPAWRPGDEAAPLCQTCMRHQGRMRSL